jgi:hypothetical protein
VLAPVQIAEVPLIEIVGNEFTMAVTAVRVAVVQVAVAAST